MIPMALREVARVVGAEARRSAAPSVQVSRVVTDSRIVEPGDLFVALRGPNFNGRAFIGEAFDKGAAACLCGGADGALALGHCPGPILMVPDPVVALGRLARHYRDSVMQPHTVVIAVTGSNGKTTTKCMIDHVMCDALRGKVAPASFNNHIGVPLTLLSADADDRYLVVEIGTNAPGEVASLAAMTSPDVAVITSIGEAHLEGLGGIDGVAAEKASLLDHVRRSGLAVVNVDRPEITAALPGSFAGRLMTIGTTGDADMRVSHLAGTIERTAFVLDGRHAVSLPLPGAYHATNAAAAFAVARWFGLAPRAIVERLDTFSPPPGRTCATKVGPVTVIDDTYNANPASMLAAVAALQTASVRPGAGRVLVMGDMLELGPGAAAFHQQVIRAVIEAGLETLVVVGAASCAAARTFGDRTGRTRVVVCAGRERASAALPALLSEGAVVWVKGSRKMELDRVVADLTEYFKRLAAVA